ncbi:MAG TPA: hypothetical protein VHX65_14810 [Pirellulales bacterium]|nr:hypothetical protein [Pirellulales bacterium]
MAVSPNSASSNSATKEEIALPSELFRTVVSLLVVIHLFVVGVAMLTNNRNGICTLLMNVKTLTPGVEPYLSQLWLDHGYDYNFIELMPEFEDTASLDWPYHLEATLDYGSGRAPEIVELPEAKTEPADRRQRLQQLAFALAEYSKWPEGPDIPDVFNDRRHRIGGSIGAGLLREHPGAKFVTLRWYYHRGKLHPETLMAELPAWTPTDPRYFTTIGRMRVELSDDGTPESIDILPQGEVAPLKSETIKSETMKSEAKPAAEAPAKSAPTNNAPASRPPTTDNNSAPQSKTESN